MVLFATNSPEHDWTGDLLSSIGVGLPASGRSRFPDPNRLADECEEDTQRTVAARHGWPQATIANYVRWVRDYPMLGYTESLRQPRPPRRRKGG
jgi:hypothetical protein